MRLQITITAAMMTTFALSGAAMADEITVSPGFNPQPTVCDFEGADQNCWEVNGGPDQPSVDEFEDIIFGVNDEDEGLEILYKDEADGNNPGEESGTAAGEYTTTFVFPEGGNEEDSTGATIVFDGDTAIDCSEGCWVWVKDGKNDPFLYIFDISYWNGMDTLHLTDFWPGEGAVSNIGILGRAMKSVPEPGTLGLLGMGLIGFAVSRRRREQS